MWPSEQYEIFSSNILCFETIHTGPGWGPLENFSSDIPLGEKGMKTAARWSMARGTCLAGRDDICVCVGEQDIAFETLNALGKTRVFWGCSKTELTNKDVENAPLVEIDYLTHCPISSLCLQNLGQSGPCWLDKCLCVGAIDVYLVSYPSRYIHM